MARKHVQKHATSSEMYTRIHVDASQKNLGTHVPLRHLSPIQPSGNGNGNGSIGVTAIADTTTAISSATTRSILFMTPISFCLSYVLLILSNPRVYRMLAASLLLSLSLAFVQCRFVSRTLVQISTRTSYSKSSNREKEGVTQNPATERTNELLKIQQEKERMSYSKSSKRER